MTLGFTSVLAVPKRLRRWSKVFVPIFLGIALLMIGCSLPQVSAESRLFLNLSASLVASYTLPQSDFNGATLGGFSALTYSSQANKIYALVDDKANPRFYTLSLSATDSPSTSTPLKVEAVTLLKDPLQLDSSEPFPTLDGEGLVLTRHGTVFVASEGNQSLKIPPRLSEFKVDGGAWQQDLPLPKQFWMLNPDDDILALGVNPNQGFESLAISAEGDRLFTATAAPLKQDASQPFSRFLHYWIGEPEPILISEHLYPLDSDPKDGTLHALTDLVSIDNAGHFLSLERSYSPTTGYGATLYQLATGVATDISGIRTLPPSLKGIVPILKQPLLNLAELNIPLQNLEGLSIGPQLTDGSRSLLLISDNGAKPAVPTQVLMLRLGKRLPQAKT
jgi:hypothetical protein